MNTLKWNKNGHEEIFHFPFSTFLLTESRPPALWSSYIHEGVVHVGEGEGAQGVHCLAKGLRFEDPGVVDGTVRLDAADPSLAVEPSRHNDQALACRGAEVGPLRGRGIRIQDVGIHNEGG